MNLLVTKGVFHISANENKINCSKEIALVELATKMICEDLGLTCGDGCDDEDEYYNTIASEGMTRVEIKEAFRKVKKEIKSL